MVYYVTMSSTSNTQISVIRNNDRNLAITVTKDGAVVDITDWIIYFSVKAKRNDPDSEAIIYKKVEVHTDPTQGESSIAISADDTKDQEVDSYFYDLLFVDDQNKRQSTRTGIFQIVQEITDGDI